MATTSKQAAQTNENPYRIGGGYWASVQALKSLGVGKMHKHADILKAVRKAMGPDGWKEFASRKGKMTADERALCNVMVTARADYGAPLKAVGYEVRWDGRKKVAGLFKLAKAPKAKAKPKTPQK